MRLPDAAKLRIILLDIEGTTTPIEFVYDVLFPYARRNLEAFLHKRAGDSEIRPILAALEEQRQLDLEKGLSPPARLADSDEDEINSLALYAEWLMANDSKCTALKSLQGKIWREGFANGELLGQVYADVPRAFERWRRQGKSIYIYSSGSVLAQQLLFQNTNHGDLTPLLAGFFDTLVGRKTDPESYCEIAARVQCAPHEILFISDAEKELQAARSAGMHTALSIRAGPTNAPETEYVVIHTFDELFPD